MDLADQVVQLLYAALDVVDLRVNSLKKFVYEALQCVRGIDPKLTRSILKRYTWSVFPFDKASPFVAPLAKRQHRSRAHAHRA